MLLTTAIGGLRVTTMRPDGRLGAIGSKGTVIDTNVITKRPDLPFGQGAEGARSALGTEIVRTKVKPDGSGAIGRA